MTGAKLWDGHDRSNTMGGHDRGNTVRRTLQGQNCGMDVTEATLWDGHDRGNTVRRT